MIVSVVLMVVAQSASPSASAATTAAARKPAESKLICINAQQLGTRLGGHRICRTKEDWAQDQRDVRMDTENAQRTSYHE